MTPMQLITHLHHQQVPHAVDAHVEAGPEHEGAQAGHDHADRQEVAEVNTLGHKTAANVKQNRHIYGTRNGNGRKRKRQKMCGNGKSRRQDLMNMKKA